MRKHWRGSDHATCTRGFMADQILSAERLRELLIYCPETGIFKAKTSRGCIRQGQVVGKARPDGYVGLALDGSPYYAHRLAFLYQHSYLPVIVDHINGERGDNRITNLRSADFFINAQNSRKEGVGNSSSRFRGVSAAGKKWAATIMANGKYGHLGRYASEAHAAFVYDSASIELHGTSGRTNFLPLVR